MDHDEELHKAWVDACMDVAHDFAEEYCNMQCDGTRSHLETATAHRTKLRNMLWDVPASMALTDPELRAGIELQKREIERLREVCDDLYSDLLAAGSLAPQDSGAYALIQESIRLRRDRWARKQTPNA